MANGNGSAASAEDREILVTRLFAAPLEMVWNAVVNPWQVTQWWGPKGFSTVMTEMNLRPGGKWKLVMHGPDGAKYPNDMTFTEVVPMERIVLELTGGREGATPISMKKTMTFAEEDGGTRFSIRLEFASAEERDQNVRDYGSIEGGKQTLERLEAHLEGLRSAAKGTKDGRHALTITRVFDAPRELVWKAWSDPEMAIQWSGPKQFPAFHMELGKKPGDRWRIGMRGKRPGTDIEIEMWQGGVLKESVPPELLIYTYAWEKRKDVGLQDDGEPHETTITVRLEEKDGKTTMHFHQEFFPTAAERDGHNGGWSSGFERLEELVNSMVAQETR
jgi:uncharacterized protein YndB with AHSA1/START domain